MFGRIFRKSCRMAWRSGKRFYGWVVFYTILTLTVGFFLQLFFDRKDDDLAFNDLTNPIVQLILVIVLALGFAYFYANSLVAYRKREIATLKCIGWSNNDVYKLIASEILLVTGIAFLIVFEVAIHVFGIQVIAGAFNQEIAAQPIVPGTLVWTAVLVIGIQFLPALLAIRKILNIEPITALRSN